MVQDVIPTSLILLEDSSKFINLHTKKGLSTIIWDSIPELSTLLLVPSLILQRPKREQIYFLNLKTIGIRDSKERWLFYPTIKEWWIIDSPSLRTSQRLTNHTEKEFSKILQLKTRIITGICSNLILMLKVAALLTRMVTHLSIIEQLVTLTTLSN